MFDCRFSMAEIGSHSCTNYQFISDLDLFGNALADKLADRASLSASHIKKTSDKVISTFALTQKIQARLTSILDDIIKTSPDRGRE